MSAGIFVICPYKPKPGKEQEFLEVLKTHIPILSGQGLVREQKSLVLRSKNGTIIEIFEWKSQEAIEQAHKNPAVLEMWKEFDKTCTYEKLADLEECKNLFAGFIPVEL
jgi:quinol monooxygenase YgiN